VLAANIFNSDTDGLVNSPTSNTVWNGAIVGPLGGGDLSTVTGRLTDESHDSDERVLQGWGARSGELVGWDYHDATGTG